MFLSSTVRRNSTNVHAIHTPLRDLAWLNGLGAKALAINLEHSASWPHESEHFLSSALVTLIAQLHLCYTGMLLSHSTLVFLGSIIKSLSGSSRRVTAVSFVDKFSYFIVSLHSYWWSLDHFNACCLAGLYVASNADFLFMKMFSYFQEVYL